MSNCALNEVAWNSVESPHTYLRDEFLTSLWMYMEKSDPNLCRLTAMGTLMNAMEQDALTVALEEEEPLCEVLLPSPHSPKASQVHLSGTYYLGEGFNLLCTSKQ
ncbi:hypothetical protein SUGI_0622050 [Cryptomeria japonica]|nr:hypothetical protein SUGI_0622050 [Cryptomeria japonica]